MMLTSISIPPPPPEYYKEFVAKNNTSARERTWDLPTFRGGPSRSVGHVVIFIATTGNVYQFNIVIFLFPFVQQLCFKTENILARNLKIYIKSHKNNSTKIQLDLDGT